jgi:lipoate-protein ligase A
MRKNGCSQFLNHAKLFFMKYTDLTLPSPEENLALDEALLDLCEEGFGHEILRFWESPSYFVVAGYSNAIQSEINISACRKDGIPILRRASGGGTVLQGPGCLNYTLILKISRAKALRGISSTNAYIMKKHARSLSLFLKQKVEFQGSSDLTINHLKFSGNAQRRKKHFLLFHGTLLTQFDLSLVTKYLRMPSKEPDYRMKRRHADFITNVNLGSEKLKSLFKKTWRAEQEMEEVPLDKVSRMVETKYKNPEWIFRE